MQPERKDPLRLPLEGRKVTLIQNKDTQPTPRKSARGFWTAMLSTGLPFVALFVITMSMARRGGEFVWVVALALCILALVASAAFGIAEKRRIALGILAGTAIGVIGLVVSCSTVLAASA
jgi:hypothetical protein